MAVLITYVGTHDPFGAGATGPILSILEHLDRLKQLPGRVVLVFTQTHSRAFELAGGGREERLQEGVEKEAIQTEKEITSRYEGKVNVVSVPIEVNPADLDEVIEKSLEGLRAHLVGDEEVHVNVSSGTPAMSAALTFLVDSGHIRRCQVWQSLNPAKLPPGAVRVKRVNLAYLSERDRLERALALLRAMAFASAAEHFGEISSLTLIPERRPKADAVRALVGVYALWDQGDYELAWERLSGIEERLRDLGAWGRIREIDRQKGALEEVCRDREQGRRVHGEPVETQAILEDLHAGLLRRFQAGQLLSIPTRARRIYEGLINYLLYDVGLNPRRDIDVNHALFSDLNPGLRRVLATMRPRLTRPDLAARADLVDLLAEARKLRVSLEDVRSLKRAYRNFADARNLSMDEHGLSGVTEPEARTAVDSATRMMDCVFGGFAKRHEEHPFGVQAVEEVVRGIEAWFSV